MKKYLTLFLLLIMLIPYAVNAESSDSSIVDLESIELNTINGNAEEITEASIKGKKINLDLKLCDPGDSIEYNLKVKNTSNEDFYFDEESSKLNTDYLRYEFAYDDNSNIIEAGKEKIIRLIVEYKNKAPTEKLVNDSLNDTNRMTLSLYNLDIINDHDTLKNPDTGDIIVRYMLILILCSGTSLIFFKTKKSEKYIILVIAGASVVPISVYASCKYDIEIESKIEIAEKKAYFLTGPEVNVKMKQLAGTDTSTSGANTNDTNITSIKYSEVKPNNSNKEEKNLVSSTNSPFPIYMWYDNGTIYWWSEDKNPSLNSDASRMFRSLSKLTSLSELSEFDSSNVTNMQTMFLDDISLTNLHGLENWDTSSVTTMRAMFKDSTSLTNLNSISNWDTSNVTTMQNMFYNNTSLTDASGINDWNIKSNVTFTYMFSYTSTHP